MSDRWDYIIVGAGTAGCILASRLSENPKNSVLLIEAGGERRNPWLFIPVGYFKTVGNPAVDWMLETEPEPGLANRRIPWPRGKVIGGSGSINGLIYVRGQPQDFDAWRDAGCAGWGWDDLLPYFMRSERNERGANAYHAADGPLAIGDNRADFNCSDLFVESAKQYGIPYNDDCNDGVQEGVGFYQTTTLNGFRASTASGYLRSARQRPNLTVTTKAHCEHIIFSGRRATGVSLRDHNQKTKKFLCNRAVILAAGAIGSPHLLMLSGVGDAHHLKKYDIPIVADSPDVGKNLQDHLKIHNSYKTRIKTLNDDLNSVHGKIKIALNFAIRRKGPMTMGAAPVFCFARSTNDAVRPDVQFHVLPWSSARPSTGVMDSFSGFTASVCPLQPESRGDIRLQSSDPMTPPLIRANYLATENDRRTAVASLRLARAICAEKPLRDLIAEEHSPGDSTQSDEELLAYIQKNASTIFHPVGTCRMGADANAVVDPTLRVNGVDGLCIADASIMPTIPSGNTNAPTVAIAEKASELILSQQ